MAGGYLATVRTQPELATVAAQSAGGDTPPAAPSNWRDAAQPPLITAASQSPPPGFESLATAAAQKQPRHRVRKRPSKRPTRFTDLIEHEPGDDENQAETMVEAVAE